MGAPQLRRLIALSFAVALSRAPAFAGTAEDTASLVDRVVAAESENWRELLSALEALRAAKAPIGVEALYFEARALAAAQDWPRAGAAVSAYLTQEQGAGAYHDEAVKLRDDLPGLERAAAARAAAAKAAAEAALEESRARTRMFAALEREFGGTLTLLGKVVRLDSEWGYAAVQLERASAAEDSPLAVFNAPGAEPLKARVGRVKDKMMTFQPPARGAVKVGAQVYGLAEAAK